VTTTSTADRPSRRSGSAQERKTDAIPPGIRSRRHPVRTIGLQVGCNDFNGAEQTVCRRLPVDVVERSPAERGASHASPPRYADAPTSPSAGRHITRVLFDGTTATGSPRRGRTRSTRAAK